MLKGDGGKAVFRFKLLEHNDRHLTGKVAIVSDFFRTDNTVPW